MSAFLMPQPFTATSRAVVLAVSGLLSQLLVPCATLLAQQGQLQSQLRVRNTIPSGAYFLGIEQLYRGKHRDALRTFQREVRGSVKIGVTDRWIDAISYHAMLGEVYYQQGQLALALEQFDYACAMFLNHPNWMLRVEFKPPQPDSNRLNRPPPWGPSNRQFTLGRFPDQMLIRIGDLHSTARVLNQGGGVVTSPQLWQLNVVEIVRSTALALRRRSEILGPLAKFDPLSKNLVSALSRGGAPPNHWSNAWVDLQLGLAYAGQGKLDLAMKRLERGERVAGQYDHPLTCVALLEMGRLQMDAGKLEVAQQLFAEASISAFYYDDLGIIDEAFRLGTICRLARDSTDVNPALEPALAWSRRKGYDHLFAGLCFAQTEELLAIGNGQGAAAALKAGISRLRDSGQGLLGNRSRYLGGLLLLADGHVTADEALLGAVAEHIGMSTHNYQLALANARFDGRQLQDRSALKVYQSLLGDPEPAQWVFRPLETLAALKTPHHAAFDRWLAAIKSKDIGRALEIVDLAKRHRYLQSLPWGGRLAALRHTLAAPDEILSQHARGQRNELLLRYPEYVDAQTAGKEWLANIRTNWKEGLNDRAERDLAKVWSQWQNSLEARENMLGRMGAQRLPADIQFPPVKATADWQAQLQPGQAVIVFHDTPDGLHGFLLTAKSASRWNCGPSGRFGSHLQAFLRDLGNYAANHEMSSDVLSSEDWHKSGGKLFEVLLGDASLDPESMTDLLVVPDGLTWYVPWSALPVQTPTGVKPLISTTRIRIVPTVGIAFGPRSPLRRVQRSGIAGKSILPGKTADDQEAALAELRRALENPLDLTQQLPVPNPVSSALLDMLVVLDEAEISLSEPFGWSPIPQGRSSRHTALGHWLQLPQFGPQRVLLPATNTIAARGGKTSKRQSAILPPGTELFLASCGLLSTGSQTVLFSNWLVGGQSTQEIVREFVQELPHISAPDAWQRSVQLARELPIDPASEPRVKAAKDDRELTAEHPFFWGGYLLIDISTPPANPAADDAAREPVARLGLPGATETDGR